VGACSGEAGLPSARLNVRICSVPGTAPPRHPPTTPPCISPLTSIHTALPTSTRFAPTLLRSAPPPPGSWRLRQAPSDSHPQPLFDTSRMRMRRPARAPLHFPSPCPAALAPSLCSAALGPHTGLQVLGMSHLYLDAFPDVLAALPALKVLYLGGLLPAAPAAPAAHVALGQLAKPPVCCAPLGGAGRAMLRGWAGHAAHAVVRQGFDRSMEREGTGQPADERDMS
jgi:hypothetical protein